MFRAVPALLASSAQPIAQRRPRGDLRGAWGRTMDRRGYIGRMNRERNQPLALTLAVFTLIASAPFPVMVGYLGLVLAAQGASPEGRGLIIGSAGMVAPGYPGGQTLVELRHGRAGRVMPRRARPAPPR